MDISQTVILLFLCHLCLGIYLPRPSTKHPALLQIEPRCPFDCHCNFDKKLAICQNGFSLSLLSDKSEMYGLKTLSIKNVEEVLQEVDFSHFPLLEDLDLSHNVITEIPENAFHGNANLKSLKLSFNYIHSLNHTVFNGLTNLQHLDLSNNNLQQINEKVFDDLQNLVSLNLSMNAIITIPLGAFKNLKNLQNLDLTANELMQLTYPMLDGLNSIDVLNVSHNNLVTISETLAYHSDHLTKFVISRNNFDCSCELLPLISRIKSHPTKYGNVEDLFCNGKYRLLQLENITMPCESPHIYFISNSTRVAARHTVNLKCHSLGVPASINYWRAPWGENFAHPHVKHILQSYNITAVSDSTYMGYSLGLISEIRVKDDGSLFIDFMRGYFAGDYTCVTLNGIGSMNHSVNLQIYDILKGHVYSTSLIIGAITMVCAFLTGIIFGSISLCVQKCPCCKCCSCCSCQESQPKIPEFQFTIEEVDINVPKHNTLESCNSYESYEPPCTPFNSPLEQTPRASPLKCPTPSVDMNGDKTKSPNIKDTLEEVKVRLEKKMEKVRGHVNTIKETGSVYFSSIKGTAATKVASGMEQVKFGVRSIKEFCGTGDMGTQTISALSFNSQAHMATQTEDVTEEPKDDSSTSTDDSTNV